MFLPELIINIWLTLKDRVHSKFKSNLFEVPLEKLFFLLQWSELKKQVQTRLGVIWKDHGLTRFHSYLSDATVRKPDFFL